MDEKKVKNNHWKRQKVRQCMKRKDEQIKQHKQKERKKETKFKRLNKNLERKRNNCYINALYEIGMEFLLQLMIEKKLAFFWP